MNKAEPLLRRILRRVRHLIAKNDDLAGLRVLAEDRDWLALERDCRTALEARSDDGEVRALLAFSLQQQGRFDESVVEAAAAALLVPSSYLPHFIAGMSLRSLERQAEAVPFLRRAFDLAPGDRQSLRHLAEALAGTEGMEIAAITYERLANAGGLDIEIMVAPISSVVAWALSAGLPVGTAGPIEEVPFTTPRVWNSESEPITVMAESNLPYVVDIPGARIFGQSSIIVTQDGTALNDSACEPEFGRYVSFAYENSVIAQLPDRVLLDHAEYTTREIPGGIMLAGLASDAFGHWLPEFLPKLQFLQQHPNFASLPIIVDAGIPQSHLDHLGRLADNPIIALKARESLVCAHLLVAPSPTFFPVELFPHEIPVERMAGLSPRAMRFLRGTESPDDAPSRTRRIFLGRRNMRWRRLLNESEIEQDLATLGFETVYAGDLTAREQIDLFEQAAWIVAPNGSALLNLVFASTDVRLVVLTQPRLFNWGTFQGPMDALGYESRCVRGDYAVAEEQKHSDYRISLVEIRGALASLGLSEALELDGVTS